MINLISSVKNFVNQILFFLLPLHSVFAHLRECLVRTPIGIIILPRLLLLWNFELTGEYVIDEDLILLLL